MNTLPVSNCVILVPCGDAIAASCEQALRILEERGYTVRRVRGFSQIDVARNCIASTAIQDGFAETLWIGSDIGFDPDDVEKLRRHQLASCMCSGRFTWTSRANSNCQSVLTLRLWCRSRLHVVLCRAIPARSRDDFRDRRQRL